MTWASDPVSTDLFCPDLRIRFAARLGSIVASLQKTCQSVTR
jgi:hypothetical protein